MRTVERATERPAVAVFTPDFPGVRPIAAPDLAHAIALLRAFRPFARPEHADVHVMVENAPALADALVAFGATPKVETLFLRGPI